jgi:hypothetical protein
MNREFQPDKSSTLSRSCYCAGNPTPRGLMRFDVPDEIITEMDMGDVLEDFAGELNQLSDFRVGLRAPMKTARPQRTVCPQQQTPHCSAVKWRRVPRADLSTKPNRAKVLLRNHASRGYLA